MKKTTLGFESLESKRALSSVSVVSAPPPQHPQAFVARVQAQQTRPVLHVPSFVGLRHGVTNLSCITVSGSNRPIPFLVIVTDRGGKITSTIRDGNVDVRLTTNAVGGAVVYIGGSPEAINRNMKYLTYTGPATLMRVQLCVCNVTSRIKYEDVRIPIRNI